MKSLTEVNGKLTELHKALDQVIGFLGKTQGEIVSLKAAVGGILGEAQSVRVVRRKRKPRVSVAAQPNGPDGAVQVQEAPAEEVPPEEPAEQPEEQAKEPAQEADSKRQGSGWPKGKKRGPRKAKPVPAQETAVA